MYNKQNYAAFNRGSFDVIKNCLTLMEFQDGANTVSVNAFLSSVIANAQNVFQHSPAFTYVHHFPEYPDIFAGGSNLES